MYYTTIYCRASAYYGAPRAFILIGIVIKYDFILSLHLRMSSNIILRRLKIFVSLGTRLPETVCRCQIYIFG